MSNSENEEEYVDIADSSEPEVEIKKPAKRARVAGSVSTSITVDESKDLYVQKHSSKSHMWSSQLVDAACIKLLTWYQQNGRVLPWRERIGIADSTFAYRIWVSEIMLQQTRVEAVIEYFHRWMKVFPTIEELSNADMDTVRQNWAGLGYYNRATSLHEGAKHQWEKYAHTLPPAEAWGEIKGIGPYTLGAIQTIVYGLPTPALDTNVIRVMGRTRGMLFQTSVLGTSKNQGAVQELNPTLDVGSDRERLKILTEYTKEQYTNVYDRTEAIRASSDNLVQPNTNAVHSMSQKEDKWFDILSNKGTRAVHMPYNSGNQCAELTQAQIELGALVCTAVSAKCGQCPLATICAAKKEVDLGTRTMTISHQWKPEDSILAKDAKSKKKVTTSSSSCIGCSPMYLYSAGTTYTEEDPVTVEMPGSAELYGFAKKTKPNVLPYISSKTLSLELQSEAIEVTHVGKPVQHIQFHGYLQTRPYDKKTDKTGAAGFFYQPKFVVYALFVRRPSKGVLSNQWTLMYDEDNTPYRPEVCNSYGLSVGKKDTSCITYPFDKDIFTKNSMTMSTFTDSHEFSHLIHQMTLDYTVISSTCPYQHELVYFGNTSNTDKEMSTTHYQYCWAPVNLGDLRTTLGLSTQTIKAVALLNKIIPRL